MQKTLTPSQRPNQHTQERLPWAEEALVPRVELDERRARVAELEQQVCVCAGGGG